MWPYLHSNTEHDCQFVDQDGGEEEPNIIDRRLQPNGHTLKEIQELYIFFINLI